MAISGFPDVFMPFQAAFNPGFPPFIDFFIDPMDHFSYFCTLLLQYSQ